MSKKIEGYFGTQRATARSSEFNAITYVVRELLSERAHLALVRVTAVDDGGLLEVQPLVNQVGADGDAIEHGVISGIPAFQHQAGSSAIVLVPVVGDIGLCLFADRDISSVKDNRGVSNPGSARQSDMADGLYLGGYLNDEPTQYVRLDADGIVIHSPTLVRLEAPNIEIVAEQAISMSAETVTMDASDSTTITTPTFTVNGNSQLNGTATVSGLASLNGGFAAQPRSGGGASTINSPVTITGATDITGALTNNGKSVGSAIKVTGVQPGGGQSSGVV